MTAHLPATSKRAHVTRSFTAPLTVVLLALGAAAPLFACDSDSVTADCPAMPQIDPITGEVVEPSEWTQGPGPGGALNRWREETAKTHPECITLPGAGGATP